MMSTTILEPLRWTPTPARVTVYTNGSGTGAFYQVIAPRNAERLCVGRPVEEVPRILTILSPAHHLVSALTLDRLFNVEPPPPAVHMREALLRIQFFKHHIRILWLLLSSSENPFRQTGRIRRPGRTEGLPLHVLEEIKHHEALAQEAETILGGRPDHPVAAVAGGVGRFLKEPHYDRLSEIAGRCLEFSVSLANLLNKMLFGTDKHPNPLFDFALPSMPSMASSADDGTVVLRGSNGSEIERFTPEDILDKVGFERESWTYQPFAYVKSKGWRSVLDGAPESFFYVGPSARINAGDALPTSLAEEERQHMIADLGEGPYASLGAAYRGLMIELIGAAEGMVDLCRREQLTGPSIRVIPTEMGRTAAAALEAPEGLIAHRYEVDDRGIVQGIQVLDGTSGNNALRCLLVRKAVEATGEISRNMKDVKRKIEEILLPF